MSGGLEEAARYEEQQMKEALETGKLTGKIKELNSNERGGYAPLVPRRFENEFPEHVIDTALRETGLDKLADDLSALGKQVGGSHYKNLKIQPMEFCMVNELDFATSNVIKYLVRRKGDSVKRAEDLRKAIHCIQLLAEHEGLVL